MKLRKFSLFLAVLMLVSVLSAALPVPVGAASSGELKKQLEELKKQNQELEARQQALQEQYEENENEILNLIGQKNVIDQEIQLIYDQIANINSQIASYSLLIADKQDELDQARQRFEDLAKKNKERIRTMEEEGNLSYWAVLFKANSFSDLLDRLNMIEEIAAADRRRLTELQSAAQAVESARQVLETEKAAMEQTRQELDEAYAELEAKRAEADEILRQLIAKGEEFELLLQESEQLQEELMAQIAQTEKDFKDAQYQEWLATYVPPSTQTGQGGNSGSSGPSGSGWLSPLPYYTLTSPFGMRPHPILGYERMHNGVDLAAAMGTEIYAARSGWVTVAAFQANGAGNYVSINHGDGFSSIYMHMTNYIVSPGQYVSAGQVIGYVGDSGLSKGAHLHFGIAYNGSYVNPMAYI